jgi:hypothetical protein
MDFGRALVLKMLKVSNEIVEAADEGRATIAQSSGSQLFWLDGKR